MKFFEQGPKPLALTLPNSNNSYKYDVMYAETYRNTSSQKKLLVRPISLLPKLARAV